MWGMKTLFVLLGLTLGANVFLQLKWPQPLGLKVVSIILLVLAEYMVFTGLHSETFTTTTFLGIGAIMSFVFISRRCYSTRN